MLVDGVDVRECRWRAAAQIGYVPQDTFLFSVPLRENVAFGVDEADAGRRGPRRRGGPA